MKNFTKGTQQFLHDTFTMGPNGEKNWSHTFSVHCLYIMKEYDMFHYIFFSFRIAFVDFAWITQPTVIALPIVPQFTPIWWK